MLFKVAAIDIKANTLLSPWLFAAITCYAALTVIWVYVLTITPLSRAYLFTLAGSALVPVMASRMFGEELTWRYWIGLTLVAVGLLVIVRT
jgi:drug/metabolite transporter (DMT)-like permease